MHIRPGFYPLRVCTAKHKWFSQKAHGPKSVIQSIFSPPPVVVAGLLGPGTCLLLGFFPCSSPAEACRGGAQAYRSYMAGPAINLVQVYRTGLPLHWEFLRL
jgi:hypothetical protein